MKTKIRWVGIIVLCVVFLGLQTVYAEDVQPEPDPAAAAAYEEMEANLQADLAAIAANRAAVIDDIIAMWPTEPGAEADLRSALSRVDDGVLLSIQNAGSFDEVITGLGGDGLAEVRTDRDYVFTPVVPCKIADTRAAGPGLIFPGSSRFWRVYGTGGQMAAQGGNVFGCPSPRGEPRGVLINMVAVDPVGKGNVKARPIGATEGLSINYNTINTNLANAGAIRTSYLHPSGADIQVGSNFAPCHATVTVLGYFHEINGEDIAASDSSGTLTSGLSVGSGSGFYTTLAARTVTVPVNGRVVIMGEASWNNNGSDFLGCRFLENGSQVDFWWWEAGDNIFIDQHQSRFYHKTVTAGTKTYTLQCYRSGGTSATAYYRNVTVMFFEEDL